MATFKETLRARETEALSALLSAPGVAGAYRDLQDAFAAFGRVAGAYVAGRPTAEYRRAHARSIALLAMRNAEGLAWARIEEDAPIAQESPTIAQEAPMAAQVSTVAYDAPGAQEALSGHPEGTGAARTERRHCAWASCSQLFTPEDGANGYGRIYCASCAERMTSSYGPLSGTTGVSEAPRVPVATEAPTIAQEALSGHSEDVGEDADTARYAAWYASTIAEDAPGAEDGAEYLADLWTCACGRLYTAPADVYLCDACRAAIARPEDEAPGMRD